MCFATSALTLLASLHLLVAIEFVQHVRLSLPSLTMPCRPLFSPQRTTRPVCSVASVRVQLWNALGEAWLFGATNRPKRCKVTLSVVSAKLLISNRVYQEYLAKTLTDKYSTLNVQMDKVINDANSELNILNQKLNSMLFESLWIAGWLIPA